MRCKKTVEYYRLLQDKQKSISGFTLIELLVVIAIISLLVSILLPSLNKAKDLARMVACASNQRTIGVGIGFYLNDNDGFYPNADWIGAGYRCYVSLLWSYDVMPSTGIYYCPSAEVYQDTTKEDIDHWGSLGSGWNNNNYIGKYAMSYNNYLGYWNGSSWVYKLRQQNEIASPIALMFCSERPSEWHGSPISGGTMWFRPGQYGYETYGLSLPHDGEANVLWNDYHVSMASDSPEVLTESDVAFWDFGGNYH